MLLPKHKVFRSNKLRKVPQDIDADCVMCGHPDTCLAHLPWRNSGMGQKCCDLVGAHLCHDCHRYADGAAGRHDHEWRYIALTRTLERLLEMGVIIVN